MEGDDQLFWLDEAEVEVKPSEAPPGNEVSKPGMGGAKDAVASATAKEEELTRLRQDLAEVRKELAAKTVEVARHAREQSSKEQANLDSLVQARVSALASEKESRLQDAYILLETLKLTLSQKEEVSERGPCSPMQHPGC